MVEKQIHSNYKFQHRLQRCFVRLLVFVRDRERERDVIIQQTRSKEDRDLGDVNWDTHKRIAKHVTFA